ncbi:putative cleavage and polyadenylation specificity factor subunit 1 [Symbiodinium microadriaticum]|uniref:Putative cleavage and polyadenylation specificity factor subunit 1 n=1 Tax=Symbiodinium microadriaticum TaxID=2951 RepID=A0A1Q9E178_SYMMI|nr:putative cleavage and polyadenylation specificity factor subunit 1 [Symbiodinium microadriaticum]
MWPCTAWGSWGGVALVCFSSEPGVWTSTTTSTSRSSLDVIGNSTADLMVFANTADVVDALHRLLARSRALVRNQRLLLEALEEAVLWLPVPPSAPVLNGPTLDVEVWANVARLAGHADGAPPTSTVPVPRPAHAVLLQPGLPSNLSAIRDALPGLPDRATKPDEGLLGMAVSEMVVELPDVPSGPTMDEDPLSEDWSIIRDAPVGKVDPPPMPRIHPRYELWIETAKELSQIGRYRFSFDNEEAVLCLSWVTIPGFPQPCLAVGTGVNTGEDMTCRGRLMLFTIKDKDPGILPPVYQRQRLLHQGEPLIDTAKIDGPMDLQLLLLPFVESSPLQVDAIINAAICGPVHALEAMLQLPTDPDVADASLKRPLAWASYMGHIDIVNLLLEARANIELPDDRGVAPLHFGALSRRPGMVKLLLEARASADLADNRGVTALHVVALRGVVAIVKLLVEARANTELSDTDGGTALHFAACRGHAVIVNLLLGARATTEMSDSRGGTALDYAVADCDVATCHGAKQDRSCAKGSDGGDGLMSSLKAPVTVVGQAGKEHFLHSEGFKFFVEKWENSSFNKLALFDGGICMTSMSNIKNFMLFGDVRKGIDFCQWKEEISTGTRTIRRLSRSSPSTSMTVLACEFIVHQKSLGLVALDQRGNAHLYQYTPHSDGREGDQILRSCATFAMGAPCRAVLRLQTDPSAQSLLMAAGSGELFCLRPIDDQAYRTITTLLGMLFTRLPFRCGLNPRAFRSHDGPATLLTPRKNIEDAVLIRHFAFLSLPLQQTISQKMRSVEARELGEETALATRQFGVLRFGEARAFEILYEDLAPVRFACDVLVWRLEGPVAEAAPSAADLAVTSAAARELFELIDREMNCRSVDNVMQEVDADGTENAYAKPAKESWGGLGDGSISFLEFMLSASRVLFGVFEKMFCLAVSDVYEDIVFSVEQCAGTLPSPHPLPTVLTALARLKNLKARP